MSFSHFSDSESALEENLNVKNLQGSNEKASTDDSPTVDGKLNDLKF